MTVEEIIASAPKDATHYRLELTTGLPVFIKNYQFKWCDEFVDGQWEFVSAHEMYNIKPLY